VIASSTCRAGFKVICDNASTPVAGMADEERRFYGVQFHPEVTHTPAGQGHPRPLCT
jgi:GMP synthase (glutamine-hydrolysing)